MFSGTQQPPLVSLRPSWPNLFRPQPNTAPERVMAKLWAPPADSCAKGMPCKDCMIWGVEILDPCIPSPSCPNWFWPQEKTWPPIKRKITWTVNTKLRLRWINTDITNTSHPYLLTVRANDDIRRLPEQFAHLTSTWCFYKWKTERISEHVLMRVHS